MKTKVKICGVRTVDVAIESITCGADFLGFNFVKDSRRYIDPQHALEIISALPKETKVVGVFRNETKEHIKRMIDLLHLDFVQLHGTEPSSYSELTQYAGVIKTILLYPHYSYRDVQKQMDEYDVDFFLLDRPVQGEGELINLSAASVLSRMYKIFIAGGLTSENVRSVIETASPFGVDVASFIETNGEQDISKIRQFIDAVKGKL